MRGSSIAKEIDIEYKMRQAFINKQKENYKDNKETLKKDKKENKKCTQ